VHGDVVLVAPNRVRTSDTPSSARRTCGPRLRRSTDGATRRSSRRHRSRPRATAAHRDLLPDLVAARPDRRPDHDAEVLRHARRARTSAATSARGTSATMPRQPACATPTVCAPPRRSGGSRRQHDQRPVDEDGHDDVHVTQLGTRRDIGRRRPRRRHRGPDASGATWPDRSASRSRPAHAPPRARGRCGR
jgi:hypothetical protein